MSKIQPLVSVVVVNLNGAKVIELCIDRLLRQTYANYEIIVVDNGSTDRSLEILNGYIGQGRLTVISMSHNCGCAGGRNVGLRYAKGEIVAFMDNDGYACDTWLKALVDKFNEDEKIGAVASVVFFHSNKLVLNGAGGTINFQGYGGDNNFFEPYEFASLPEEVLYPMGCGMAIRGNLLNNITPWDDALPNYYDDTEIGIRVWKYGYRVVVAEHAWVDHYFNYSSEFLSNKVYLNEAGRIRLALKYYPLGGFFQWLWKEILHLGLNPFIFFNYLRAWLWNIWHLPSALRIRLGFGQKFLAFDRFVQKSWGWFPMFFPAVTYRPQMKALTTETDIGRDPNPALVYGWYYVEYSDGKPYRFSSRYASVLLRTSVESKYLKIGMVFSLSGRLRVIVRYWGDLKPAFDFYEELAYQPKTINLSRPCNLPPGDYEVLIIAEDAVFDGRRTLGFPISRISLL